MSLGWDLSDSKDCIVEYRVRAGRQRAVDYALLDGGGNPVILTWTKRIEDHTERDENREQVYGYMMETPTTNIVVVTNGQYWAIQVRGRGGIWQPENRRPLNLHWQDVGGNAERLNRHLDRSRHR